MPTDSQAANGRRSHWLRGVVPILLTPFDESGEIDAPSLARQVELNVAAGVHGLGIAIGSEMFKLTETERDRLVALVVETVAGRVPVLVNTSADGTRAVVAQSRRAEALGATAVMIFPPNFMPLRAPDVVRHFHAVADAINLPIVLQDIAASPIPPALALAIAEGCERIVALKAETPPLVPRVAEAVLRVGHRLDVFGGSAGTYFVEELRRGSAGTMPFASQPEDFVAVWNLFQRGDVAEAEAVFDRRIVKLNRMSLQGEDIFYHVNKMLLVKRGVLQTAVVREPTRSIDEITRLEIEAALTTVC